MTRKALTTTAGAPVGDNQNSLSAGERGPLLLQDWRLLEKLAHQNRERIPERVVHAKGWGAHGEFTVTQDITLTGVPQAIVDRQLALFDRIDGEYGQGVRSALGFSDKERQTG